MKQVYSRTFSHVWATGETTKVFADRVQPGNVLHVQQCFAYAPERDQNDDVIIGIRRGGEDIILFALAPAAAQKGAEVQNHFTLGELDQLFADFPDVENGDTIAININAVLQTLDDWQRD